MLTVTRYTAPWCRPCEGYAPVLESVLDEYPEVELRVVDIDDDPDAIVEHEIMTVPTTTISRDGVEVSRFTGVRFKSQIVTAIESAL
jgi:thioredoxin 1